MLSFTYKMIRFTYILCPIWNSTSEEQFEASGPGPQINRTLENKTQKGRLQSTSYEEEEEKMKG